MEAFRFRAAVGACVLLGAAATAPAAAQDFPAQCQVLKIIVPYSPGASADLAARVVAERLGTALGKTMVVENKPGAGGNIGTEEVARARPDGCTLLMNGTVIATFVHSFPKLGYHPFNDLVPVGSVGITPTLTVVPAKSPFHSFSELVEAGKAKPDTLNYSIAGYGLQQHLAIEEVMARTGARFVYVPYKGAGGAGMTDLLAGRVDFASFLAATVAGFIKNGQLRALAVMQDKRSPLFPDLPATGELGLKGLYGGVHFLLFAPAKTPRAIVDRLDGALAKVVGSAEVKERLAGAGMEATVMSSAQMAAEMQALSDALGPTIKRLGIRLE